MSTNEGMDKENLIHTYKGVTFNHKERYPAICSNMDGTWEHMSSKKRQESWMLYDLTYMWNLVRPNSKTEQTSWLPEAAGEEMDEGSQKVQISSCKI